MDLANTLQLLARDPQLVAWRPRGIVIRLTENQVMQRVFVPKPYRWVPNYGDVIAFDWQSGTVDALQKSVKALTAEETA
jgi:hypothetical protein